MDESLAGSCRSYGNVHASDNSRVIVGDYRPNIQIENPTFNISRPCLCDNVAKSRHIAWGCDIASLTSTCRSASTSNSGTSCTKIRVNQQGYCPLEYNLSGAERQDIKYDSNSRELDITCLHMALASAITSSTPNEQRRRKVEALAGRLEIVPEAAIHTSQRLSKCVTVQNNTAHQNSKTASTYGDDMRCGGNNDHRRTSAASLKASADAREISVVFQDDLKKPYTFAREDSQYRIFFLRKEGPDWTQSICTESLMPTSEINERIKHGPTKSRQREQNIKRTLERLEPQRRYTSEHLLHEVNRCDRHGHKWYIVAIDNENARLTRRTREVALFSVILARVSEI